MSVKLCGVDRLHLRHSEYNSDQLFAQHVVYFFIYETYVFKCLKKQRMKLE